MYQIMKRIILFLLLVFVAHSLPAKYMLHTKELIDNLYYYSVLPWEKVTNDALDQDYYAVSLAIRKISALSTEDLDEYGITSELHESCKNYCHKAWNYNINQHDPVELLAIFEDCIPEGPLTTQQKKVYDSFMDDVDKINNRIKEKSARRRPWYDFWEKFGTSKAEIMKLIEEDYTEDEMKILKEGVLKVFVKYDPRLMDPKYRSYPSGHATAAFSAALILSRVLQTGNDKTDKEINEGLIKRACEFAMARVTLGVHHYTDILASYRLSRALIKEVESWKNFQDDLNAINNKYIPPRYVPFSIQFESNFMKGN